MPKTLTCGSPGKRTEFTYEGTVADGVVLRFASGSVHISPELLGAAINQFRDKEIKGGFSMTEPAPDGFGKWIEAQSKKLNKTVLTPRHGSFIAAILREEGYLKSTVRGAAVILTFRA